MILTSATTEFIATTVQEHAGKSCRVACILQARGDPCHVNLAYVHYFATEGLCFWQMASDRHGMVHQGRDESNQTWQM